jgi:hypothetical protein
MLGAAVLFGCATADRTTGSSDTMQPSQPAGTTAPKPTMPPDHVIGEIAKIDGESYLVKTAARKEVRFNVDKETRQFDENNNVLAGGLKVGDKVEAQVEPQGNAWSIKKMSAQADRTEPSGAGANVPR